MITFGKKRISASKAKEASKWDEFISKTKNPKNVDVVDQKPPLVPVERISRSSARKRPSEEEPSIKANYHSESMNSNSDHNDLVSEVSAFDCIDQISPVKPKIKGRVKRMERQRSSPLKPAAAQPTEVGKKAKRDFAVYKVAPNLDDGLKASIPLPVRRQSAVTYSRNGSGSLISSNPSAPDQTSREMISPLEQLFDSLEQEDQAHVAVDEGLESSSDEDKKKPKIQGYHHLKTAGQSKRVLDETNYLFEGLHSPTLSIQRSSCFDIIKKLGQEDFATSLRIHGKIKTVFASLFSVKDSIIQSALIFIIGILAKDVRNLEGIVDDKFMVWIVDGMEKYSLSDVLVTLPKKKYDKVIVQDLIKLIQGYDLGITTIEPLLFIAAKAIAIKGSGFMFSPSESLAIFLKKQIMEERDTDNCMVLFESAIGTPQSRKVESFCDAGLVAFLWHYFKDKFGCLCLTLESRIPGKVDHLTRVLRILINLHGPKYFIEKPKSDTDIQKLLLYFIICRKLVSNENEESYFDLQIHLLGLMTNLVENNVQEASNLCNSKRSIDCRVTCKDKCKCKEKLDGLSILAKIFSSAYQAVQDHESDPSFSVSCAYIAILIANVIKHRLDDRLKILSLLPNNCFDAIVQMIEEFSLFHAAVQQELNFEFEGGNYAQNSLRKLVDILQF